MEKYGQIAAISNGVVFSDPWYGPEVLCQYRKEFTDTNWLMKLEAKAEDGFIPFTMTIGRPTVLAGVKTEPAKGGIQISFPERYDLQEVEIGMDTASIFCGTKDHWDAFAEEGALHTGTDGTFGYLMIFTCKGESAPAGFVLMGGIEEVFVNEASLFDHFISSFDAKEMSAEHFAARTDANSLAFKVLEGAEIRHASSCTLDNASHFQKENER